jgi:hypothetical protein
MLRSAVLAEDRELALKRDACKIEEALENVMMVLPVLDVQVRKMPRWPRRWANFRLL